MFPCVVSGKAYVFFAVCRDNIIFDVMICANALARISA
jgi:hypothetical protein